MTQLLPVSPPHQHAVRLSFLLPFSAVFVQTHPRFNFTFPSQPVMWRVPFPVFLSPCALAAFPPSLLLIRHPAALPSFRTFWCKQQGYGALFFSVGMFPFPPQRWIFTVMGAWQHPVEAL